MPTPIPPSRRRRAVVGLVASITLASAATLAAAVAGPAAVAATSGSAPAAGPPHASFSAPARPSCDLRTGTSRRDEFGGCTTIDLAFASRPGVGSTTRVDITVRSLTDLDGATLTILVTNGFDLVGTAGFDDVGARPSGVGRMTAVSRSIDVSAGTPAAYSVEVTGLRAGFAVLQARLVSPGGTGDARDELDTYLGRRAPATNERRARTATVDPRSTPRRTTTLPFVTAPRKGAKTLSPRTAGASCVTGGFVYYDEKGVQVPAGNLGIDVYDKDVNGADDLLAGGVTYLDGSYDFCFESTDFDGGGGQEVYVVALTENDAWRVRDTATSNQTYKLTTGVVDIPSTGGTVDIGWQQGPADWQRLFHAYDSINQLFLWQSDVNEFAMDNPGQSRQMILNWTPTSTDGTYYSTTTEDIHLEAADPDADHVTVHEGAHALMDAIYNDDFPPAPNCNPHEVWGVTSTGCAWTEGWAEWVPARVLKDPFFRWPTGEESNLEAPSWSPATTPFPYPSGDAVEGRVAATLIDLSDMAPNNESSWDRYGEGGDTAGTEEIYQTNLVAVSDTLEEYFNVDRPGEGDTGYLARAAVYQNTIDYTHRDPLFSGQELLRPSLAVLPNPHNYSTVMDKPYWSAVAIRPTTTNDYDLKLFSDEPMTSLAGQSALGAGVVDYVVVDGHHRTGTFFPRALYYKGSDSYRIEEYNGTQTLAPGVATASFAAEDVVRTWDVALAAGQTSYVRVVPSAGLDVELFAHDSSGTSATAVQGRVAAVANSSASGAGGAESLSYTLTEADATGIVLVKKAGSGTYTVYHDTAGPASPRVTIDQAYPTTYDTTVDLALSASAGATGLLDMQISTDGTFDTETWRPYATSASIAVPSGTGTKTVSVRYRNRAGAVSAVATDTINLVAKPVTCDGVTATIVGTRTITGTTGDDVIIGGDGNDVIDGLGGDDLICGLEGSDTITDGLGADTVRGAGGNDVLNQSATVDAGDVLDGGAGADRVSYQARTAAVSVSLNTTANDGAAGEGDLVSTTVENVTGGSASDSLTGSDAANVLVGGGGNDSLFGGFGNDDLQGGEGNDTFNESSSTSGADSYNGGNGTDKVSYSLRSTSVTVNLNGTTGSGASGENDTVKLCEAVTGGSSGDFIYGYTANDTLNGLGGSDTLSGSSGADTINGGSGNDTITGGPGSDTLDSRDNVNGNDSVDGGTETDTATIDPGDVLTNVP